MRISPPRILLTVAVTGLSVVMVAGPVAANPDGEGDKHRGKVGRHAFIDSEDRPGVRCAYQKVALVTDELTDTAGVVMAELVGVAVRPPKVAAINRTDRVDRQRVGWRFILQERVGEGDWKPVKRSRIQLRRTSDKKAANFSRMKMRYDGNPEADYRVKSKAYWFNKRLRPVGVASHLVKYYRVRGEVVKASCPGGIPAPEIT